MQETATLEKIVLKLRGQLKASERVDLKQQELANKVKAAEDEINEKVCRSFNAEVKNKIMLKKCIS